MNNKMIRIIFDKPKTFKKDESFTIETTIKEDDLFLIEIKDDKSEVILFHIEPELIWIDEFSSIDSKVWERLRKISATTAISLVECANAFKQASFDNDEFVEGCKRMDELLNKSKISLKDKPVEKPYDSFINKPIGKQRRK